MPQPFDYTPNVPDPTQSLLNTVNVGRGLMDLKFKQGEAKRVQDAQAAFQKDMSGLGTNVTPAALSQLMVKYPHLSEQFKRTYDVLSEEHKKARVDQASQVYAALEAEDTELAQNILSTQAEAYRNSGMSTEAKTLEDLSEVIKVHPQTAKTSAGLFLASAMGPDKFTETFTKLQAERRDAGLYPTKEATGKAELTKAQADAKKAAVEADFSESNAVADLQKKGWDITKIREDVGIAKTNSKIAAAKNDIAREKLKIEREKNATKREENQIKLQEKEVKLDELKRKRDEDIREKSANLESARSNIDNMLNTADRILKTPIGIVESATGPISTMMPTLSQDTADFEELITNIDAQAFLAQIPNMKGLGALSDAEGKKLTAALQNFSLRQSPERLLYNIKEAQRILLKVRKNMADRHGVPETIPDTPEAESTPEEIDALLQKYGTVQR